MSVRPDPDSKLLTKRKPGGKNEPKMIYCNGIQIEYGSATIRTKYGPHYHKDDHNDLVLIQLINIVYNVLKIFTEGRKEKKLEMGTKSSRHIGK